MNKYKTTKKAMKEAWKNRLFYVPDGTMQHFGGVINPVAYSTRSEGWACDYYEFNSFCICEGYAPTGKRLFDYNECEKYRTRYHEIKNMWLMHDEEQVLFKELLDEFVQDALSKIGG